MWKKKKACLSGINDQAKQLLLKVSSRKTLTPYLITGGCCSSLHKIKVVQMYSNLSTHARGQDFVLTFVFLVSNVSFIGSSMMIIMVCTSLLNPNTKTWNDFFIDCFSYRVGMSP